MNREFVFFGLNFDKDVDDVYDFVCDRSTTEKQKQLFMKSAIEAIFERKYRTEAVNAIPAQLRALEYSPADMSHLSQLESKLLTPQPAPPKESSTVALPPGDQLASSTASLHLFDANDGVFLEQDPHVTATVTEVGKWKYWLSVNGQSKAWIGQPMEAEMNPTFNFEHLSFIWNYFDDENRAFSWLLKFTSFVELESFQEGVMRALWESLNEQRWVKATDDDRDYVLGAFKEDIEMEDAPAEEEEEEEVTEEEADRQSEHYDPDEEHDDVTNTIEGEGKNRHLAVGYSTDRSFVVRGNRIGVFKHSADDQGLEFMTTINKVQTPQGKSFEPSKIMLHNQDKTMLLQSEHDPSSIMAMDIERGQVVEEYKVHDDVAVKSFGPLNKFAQITPEQTLLGISGNAMYRIDPRLAGNKLVDSQFKQYASKNQFSVMATTEQGYIAVASEKGDIRLFDRVGINAKTLIPPLGEPITGIDVSANGRWVLCTCKTYLLLIDAEIKQGKYEGQLGFQKSFGKDTKPRPKRLQLKPQHVAWLTLNTWPMAFTAAKFNTGVNAEEDTIVTSVGPYVITWDMKRVLAGHAEPYKIRKFQEDIVADNFRFGQNKNIIVTTEQVSSIAMIILLSSTFRTSVSSIVGSWANPLGNHLLVFPLHHGVI